MLISEYSFSYILTVAHNGDGNIRQFSSYDCVYDNMYLNVSQVLKWLKWSKHN